MYHHVAMALSKPAAGWPPTGALLGTLMSIGSAVLRSMKGESGALANTVPTDTVFSGTVCTSLK